jgi:hypothetical protein
MNNCLDTVREIDSTKLPGAQRTLPIATCATTAGNTSELADDLDGDEVGRHLV